MGLDRRTLLASGGLWLTACATGAPRRSTAPPSEDPLDELFTAHAAALPERAGAGANHYPMAAEALVALGRPDAIEPHWVRDARLYDARTVRVAPRRAPIAGARAAELALGDYARYRDWLDHFRGALARAPWRTVLRAWAPRLAPGICAGAFHGVIRAGHAVRALRDRETPARRHELAVGLAYWAARHAELPTARGFAVRTEELRATLPNLEQPWVADRSDVDFFGVVERLRARPLAPEVGIAQEGADPRAELAQLVREASVGFLEMLVLERHRIWLLHTVTGPAAVGLLLPELEPAGARTLVAHARRAVVAMYAAFGEPYEPEAHLRSAPPDWVTLVDRAVATRSVHTIKLVDALLRYDAGGDTLARSVAAQWLEWT